VSRRPRLVGLNHVALEVGDLEEALAFYGRIFDVELRGRAPGMAFVDLGDQFLALSEGRRQAADDDRHLGLVVDDRDVQFTKAPRILAGMGLDLEKRESALEELRAKGLAD
jgi:catechol 2,3-dioxygenase-like lactoylglutathione lyase family enzyme